MWNTRFITIAIPLLLCISNAVTAQEEKRANLTVTASTQLARSSETITLEIILRNSSRESFYLSGDIKPALLEPYGNYDLQIRLVGTDRYHTTTKLSSDPMARIYGRPPTVAEFRTEKNILLLPPNQFIGTRLSGTWSGLTGMPPGKYDVRIVYFASEKLPVTLDRPFLTGTIPSNVVQIEVAP
jgi:hypothetical protein